MSEGQRPLSVGFFFSLGHSTIVFLLGLLVVVGVRGLSGAVRDDGSTLHQATGLVGPLVSGSFLLLIGLLNLAHADHDEEAEREDDRRVPEGEPEADAEGALALAHELARRAVDRARCGRRRTRGAGRACRPSSPARPKTPLVPRS